jgi:putative sterol carrier protein
MSDDIRRIRVFTDTADTKGGSMPKYMFLSDEWVAAAKAIRDEHGGDAGAPPHKMRMNQIITEVPFGDGVVNAHMDTSDGEIKMELGHLENPDLTVTLDYATAKAILVEGNPQAGMQAFMAGKVKVEGDMSKLMAMQTATPDPAAAKVAAEIQAITE